jgi:branched-chain amino acid transport system substrate-binding protein
VSGVFGPPEFGIFWTQCAQLGYRPKVVTPAKALLFPAAVEALGDRGGDLSTEVWWSHHHPFKSGLTGETALQFCDAYTAATGKQWTQPIGFKHANLEVAIDVLKRAKKLGPAAIRDAIVDTNYQSLVGPVAWKGGPNNPVRNACSTPLVGGQWKKGKTSSTTCTSFTIKRRRASRSIAYSSQSNILDRSADGCRRLAAANVD